LEVATCLSVIVDALDRASLDVAEKLEWALDAVLKDPFGVCENFAGYLHQRHPKSAWNTLAERLLTRLKGLENTKDDGFSRNYERDRVCDWTVHALEQAGRPEEVISLCETEAEKTGSYDRLVKRLIAAQRYEEAERWIQEGIQATKEKWPGITSGLRDHLRKILTFQKNWPAVAATRVEDFVRRPSRQAFMECKKACDKINVWPSVRESLLRYLEKGKPPWTQKGWPLPESNLDKPDTDRGNRFPLFGDLIDMAILEKEPANILHWFDQSQKKGIPWYGIRENEIAEAVKTHAPDRAVAIWKKIAESLIARVKPSAYQEAANYLRKAAKIMAGQKREKEWVGYIQQLRKEHHRKTRLMQILDDLEGQRIVKTR
jgi:uncharacterized Zn finger protein